jgi:NIMA-interacting peptidyl-prolyl cis-trans isomerase 1
MAEPSAAAVDCTAQETPSCEALRYTAPMRWDCRWLAVVGVLISCGGSSEPAKSPKSQGAKLSKGEQCLRDAAAPRDPPARAPDRIEVSHILVRHDALEDPRGATRSPEEACLRALEARKALEGGADWEKVVEKYSDAPGPTAGGLGYISPSDVEPPFANAAFGLEVNELSYVVQTKRGFHIIARTD